MSNPGKADGRYRPLLLEAAVLIRFVTGRRPSLPSLRRYCRAIARLKRGRPLPLPWVVVRSPCLMALWEPLGPPRSAAQRERTERLRYATAIVEADPSHAGSFWETRHRGVATVWLGVAMALVVEAVIVPVRLLITLSGR